MKKAQEEMVGFGLIIVVVALILLFLLWFSASRGSSNVVESDKANSFVNAVLQHTSECENSRGDFLEMRDLIFECLGQNICRNGQNSCEILNSTLKTLLDAGFSVGEDSPIKGYSLEIRSEEESILKIEKGNKTSDSRGVLEPFSKRGNKVKFAFTLYY